MNIRPASAHDFDSIVNLNEESVRFLSALSRERLIDLHAQAEIHSVAVQEGRVIAFILAFREGTTYDSINYQWFCRRYRTFLYIDRVVVSQSIQAKGVGSALYKHAFHHATATNVPLLACEYDVEPPNLGSARFHAKFGFKEVGRQTAATGKKIVSLQVAGDVEKNEV